MVVFNGCHSLICLATIAKLAKKLLIEPSAYSLIRHADSQKHSSAVNLSNVPV